VFKKKNKRSEWFQGLLEAEELYKEGYVYSFHSGPTVFFRGENCHGMKEAISGSFYKRLGVMQYVIHRMSNPEIFQKDSQEY
jgi:hypothetical protein